MVVSLLLVFYFGNTFAEDAIILRRENLVHDIEPAATNVPAECARFLGAWYGTWSAARSNTLLLVVRVEKAIAGCMAYTAYIGKDHFNRRIGGKLHKSEINNGELSFSCGNQRGICQFRFDARKLLASYSNPSGGRSNAVLEPVPIK